MECKVCSNQDMKVETRTPKTGRNAGNPCRVYSCTTPGCVNDKGYPNAIWVPIANAGNAQKAQLPNSTLEKKVDQILQILKENFPLKEVVEEEKSPF